MTEPHQFLVSHLPNNGAHQTGGILEGTVLLPSQALMTAIGGPGKEFWLDGKNYDNGGDIYKALAKGQRKQADAGSWRIEIIPASKIPTDKFLVALSLYRDWSETPPSIQCSERNDQTICRMQRTREIRLQITSDGVAIAQ